MPVPVTPWASTPLSAKAMNIALYTADGTANSLTGIAFLAVPPAMLQSYVRAASFPSSAGGTRTSMSSSGTTTSSLMVYDSAGYFGLSSDLPGNGYYQFTPVVPGAAGDGQTVGGWVLLAHFVPLNAVSTHTAVGADFTATGGTLITGGRQKPATVNPDTPFFLDLVSAGSLTWSPNVYVADSSSVAGTPVVNTADSSGNTPRLYALWAGVSASTQGVAVFSTGGVYNFTAPAGVTQVTVAAIGGGGGGGGGNTSSGGVSYGGGGAGGGEYAMDTVAVTPGTNYPVTVGSGGAAGAQGGTGGAAGSSSFSGDVASVTANGGSAGTGATVTGNGTAGAGGTGSTNATHFNGGGGAAGTTSVSGGGGGGSAGTSVAGNTATGYAGASAVAGGGPGGNGGRDVVTVLQYASGSIDKSSNLTIKLGTALQSGSTVVACVYGNGNASYSTVPTVTLSDGTVFSQQVSQTTHGGSYSFITGIYTAFNVSGGQTSVKVNANSGADQITMGQVWEVAGLGASPAVDTSNTASGQSTKYSSSATATGAPDLWVGTCGAQRLNGFGINSPGSSWNSPSEIAGNNSGNVYGRLRSGYHIATSGGSIKYAGTMSTSGDWQAMVVAFTAAATTPGNTPLLPPGGGAGGGFGANGGGQGSDGQVTLTWTGVSGSGYGTPAVPAPYESWSDATLVGTTGLVDVNINGPTGITDVVNFLSNPPLLRISTTTAQSIGNAAITPVTFTGVSATADNYLGWSAGTYTVQRDGLYLAHGLVAYAANATGTRLAGLTVTPLNFLTGDNATFDGSTGTWTGAGNATISHVTTPVHTGTGAMAITSNAAGSMKAAHCTVANILTQGLACNPGDQITGGIWFRAATVARTCQIGGGFYDVNGASLGTVYSTVTAADTTTGYTLVEGTFTAPASSAWVRLNPQVESTAAASEVHYVDDAYMVNGTAGTYWGPGSPAVTAASHATTASKTQILSLKAGDTVQLAAWQDSGGALNTATDSTRLLLWWVGEAGVPAQPWSPPDVTYRWASGTPGTALAGLFQEHLGNDLGFLVNCPYLLAYQTVVQTGLTVGAFSTVTLDMVGSITHSGDSGDSYAGWTAGASNLYTAPVAGWYLVVAEFFASSSSAAGAQVVAGVQVPSSGGMAPVNATDYFQALAATSEAAVGGGATVFGLYYLLAGETITPAVEALSYAAPYSTLVGLQNGGYFNSHMEIVWVSE